MTLETQSTSATSKINLVAELKKEFVKRCKKNSSYSMRSFARYLDIDQSLLSKIMSEKRALSRSVLEKILPKLNLSAAQMNQLLKRKSPSIGILRLQYQSVTDDELSFLGDWYHFSLLELMKTRDFESDEDWIAKRLGLHKIQVQDALDRLMRLKLVARKNGKYILLSSNNQWNNTLSTTRARQKLQKSVLEQSSWALENIDFSLRDHGSVTVAIRKNRVQDFKQKLKQVRDELDSYFQPIEDASQFDEVYQLSISFFPISKNVKQI